MSTRQRRRFVRARRALRAFEPEDLQAAVTLALGALYLAVVLTSGCVPGS